MIPERDDDDDISGGLPLPDAQDQDDNQDDIELDIVDDTPDEEKGYDDIDHDPTDPEHSAVDRDLQGVFRQRVNQLTKAVHTEKRRAASVERQLREAVEYAKRVSDELKATRKLSVDGENAYVEQAKTSAELALEKAKTAFKQAYDAGDADKLAEAQVAVAEATTQLLHLKRYKPREYEPDVPIPAADQLSSNAQQADDDADYQDEIPVEPSDVVKTWVKRNPWFNTNEAMTKRALIIHRRLVEDGVQPETDAYFRAIDTSMRKTFPEYNFGDQPVSRGAPVASGKSRPATTTNKVKLTTTEMRLCERMGVDPKEYAREKLRLDKQQKQRG